MEPAIIINEITAGINEVTPIKFELKAKLYLYQNWNAQPGINQYYVARPSNTAFFGETIVYDWSLYNKLDAKDPERKVFAHAHGTNVITSMEKQIRQNSLGLVFTKDSGFEGSSLQLMGTAIQDKGSNIPDMTEWAIVGGTGRFTLAQGVLNMEVVKPLTAERFMEVNIYALFTPLKKKTPAMN